MPNHLRNVGFCLAFCCILAGEVIGQEANREKPKVEKDWVSEQIELLDADTLRERATAEKSLLNAGPDVLPFLPPPELLPSAAVRQAVRRIRLRLEEAKARESVKASTVSIQGKMTVKEILKQITEQTGNEIDVTGLPAATLERSIELEIENDHFWGTLILVGQEAGFQIQSSSAMKKASPGISLVPANATMQSIDETTPGSGTFLIEAESVKRRPRFGEDKEQLLRVSMRIAAEPRLRPLFLKLEGKDFSARTAAKKSLPPFNPAQKLELPLGEGGHDAAFYIDFLVPKPFRERAIALKGKATLTVAAGSEDIAFTNLPKAAGTARRRGGVTVTVGEIAFAPDEKHPGKRTAKIPVTVHYDTGGPAFESHRTWIFHNQVYLEDAKGQRIGRNSDFHTALQTDGGVIVEFNFDNLPGDAADYKFIYVAPTLIINVPVGFEFDDLTVPAKS